MSLAVNVEGGTDAGRKRPLRPKPPRYWTHDCWAPGFDGEALILRGHLAACPECGVRRDDALASKT